MRKSTMLLLAATLVTGLFASIGAQAGHCGSGAGAHDKFGSCERDGDLKCASDATDVGGLFALDTTASGGNGVQACNDGTKMLPAPLGRAGVYTDGSSVQAHVDGDRDQVGSNGWTSVSASASGICVKRGSGGAYNTAPADVADECAP